MTGITNAPSSPPRSVAGTGTGSALLRGTAAVFAVAVLLHNSDHLRRGGESVTADVFWLGSAAIVLEVAVVLLVFMRHETAALAAVAVGFPLALGYLFVHFTPERTWLSDSFPSGDPSAVSWAAGSLETVAALALGIAGTIVLRRTGLAAAGRSTRSSLPVLETLRHPVVLAMVVGNVLIFALTVADRSV